VDRSEEGGEKKRTEKKKRKILEPISIEKKGGTGWGKRWFKGTLGSDLGKEEKRNNKSRKCFGRRRGFL